MRDGDAKLGKLLLRIERFKSSRADCCIGSTTSVLGVLRLRYWCDLEQSF